MPHRPPTPPEVRFRITAVHKDPASRSAVRQSTGSTPLGRSAGVDAVATPACHFHSHPGGASRIPPSNLFENILKPFPPIYVCSNERWIANHRPSYMNRQPPIQRPAPGRLAAPRPPRGSVSPRQGGAPLRNRPKPSKSPFSVHGSPPKSTQVHASPRNRVIFPRAHLDSTTTSKPNCQNGRPGTTRSPQPGGLGEAGGPGRPLWQGGVDVVLLFSNSRCAREKQAAQLRLEMRRYFAVVCER